MALAWGVLPAQVRTVTVREWREMVAVLQERAEASKQKR